MMDTTAGRQDSMAKWRAALARYEGADDRRSARQVGLNAFLFLFGLVAMWHSLSVGLWLTLIVGLPTALLLARRVAIQHDCAHQSYFTSRRANNVAGTILAFLAMTPHAYWRRVHMGHHATIGNLDRRTLGDVPLLTAKEFGG